MELRVWRAVPVCKELLSSLLEEIEVHVAHSIGGGIREIGSEGDCGVEKEKGEGRGGGIGGGEKGTQDVKSGPQETARGGNQWNSITRIHQSRWN